MQLLRTARTVPAAVRELEDFVAAANPKGRSAQAMLSSVKKNAQAWRALMDNQQRHQLSDGVRRVVKRMRNPRTRATSATLRC